MYCRHSYEGKESIVHISGAGAGAGRAAITAVYITQTADSTPGPGPGQLLSGRLRLL